MPKYAEGTVSPKGNYIVRGGKWVPRGGAAPAAPSMSQLDAQAKQEYMAGSKVAAGGGAAIEGANPAIGQAIETATYLGAGGPALLAAGSRLPGVLGGAARLATANPNVALGVASATPELLRGDVKGAAGTAVLNTAGLKGTGKFLKFLSRFGPKVAAGEAAAMETAKAAGRAKAGEWIKSKGMTPVWELEAGAAKAGTAKVLPQGQRAMATNLGGKAKPGPAPTKADELEETLKKSLDAIAKKEASVFQAPRIEVGAQKVGKAVGMTKEQVRMKAGPVLDEALGEASPILPKEPLKKIIDTMRKIPPAEREAYVARATSGKAKAQIENIRRTLEHLGLLLPVGAVAASRQEK